MACIDVDALAQFETDAAVAFCGPFLPFCAKATDDEPSTTVIAIIGPIRRPGILELLFARSFIQPT